MSPSPSMSSQSSGKRPQLDLSRRVDGPTLDLSESVSAKPYRDNLGVLIAICVVMGVVALAFLLPKALEPSYPEAAEEPAPMAEAAPAEAAPAGLYVDITNSTGFVISQIYVSPQSSDNWGQNLLSGRTLGLGETHRVDLSGHSEALFDIKLVDIDGDSYSFEDFDVTSGDVNAKLTDIDP